MRIAIVLLVLSLALPLAAQPRIAYVGMSTVLPGSAELVLGKTTRGGVMIAADLIAILAWTGYGNDVKDFTNGYKLYASQYAGVPVNNNDRYYQHIQQYYGSSDFNAFQEMMARNYYLIYNYDPESFAEYLANNLYTDDEGWQWQSPEHQQQFKSIRRKRQKAKMYQNLALGALILNRAVSAVDALFLSGKSEHTQLPVFFSVSPDRALLINYSLEF